MLLLGGNMGDVRARLEVCRELLAQRVGELVATSSEAESEPWGFTSPLKFVNQAVVVRTSLPAEELLVATQSIECDLGRDRVAELAQKELSGEVYASRKIDVDIITYGSHIIEREDLVIPHPRMHEREFVLRPMVEVMPRWSHPILNITAEELLKNVI